MPFFDLHCHPGLKTLFLSQNGNQISAWHNLEPIKLLGDILGSQCSLKQLTHKGDIPLICITLHPPEAGMIDQCIVIIGAATIYRNFMDPVRLKSMYSGEAGYQRVFREELNNLTAPPRTNDGIAPQTRVVFLQKWSDYKPETPDTLFVIFNIEGGHTLYDRGDLLGDPLKAINNLDDFLSKGFLTLYLTPTHLTPNRYINHAYGNKILTKGPLLPQGLGITADGRDLIDHAYSRGLLIDVKHMSLVSRLIFYQYRKKHHPDKPLIASHAGFTRLTLSEFTRWFTDHHSMDTVVQVNGTKPKGHLPDTAFYPLSINLYNIDIYEILSSGGLIGISLDVRILGGKDTSDTLQHDYLSAEEFKIMSLPDSDRDAKISEMAEALGAGMAPAYSTPVEIAHQPEFSQAVGEELADILPMQTGHAVVTMKVQEHVQLIVNHLLHLKYVADLWNLGLPWDRVCIGSDFDGLIEAVDCCKNSTQFDQLAALLVPQLESGAASANIPLGMDADQIVKQFCHTNAINFISRHFTNVV